MGPRVSLFVTCVVDQLFPRAGMAMAEVLERLGCDVEFRQAQTCCGQPAFNSGYREEARAVAKHFLKTFAGAEYIVIPSGSCTAMVAHHYGELFAGDAAALLESNTLARRVFEFSQFITDVLKVDDVGARFPHVVTYHDSCHMLRELKGKSSPRVLLNNVAGLELREMDAAEECCGFGGTFSVKFDGISGAMARTKIDSIARTGAEYVVSVDSSCLMQLQGALARGARGVRGVRSIHLAEVLAAR